MSDRVAPRRLWLTADFTEVVLEDDPRASFLLAGKGCVIPSKVITADGPLEVVVPDEFLEPVDESVDQLVEPKASGEPTAKKERKPRAKKAKSDPDQPATTPDDGDADGSNVEAAAGDPDGSGDQADGTAPPV